ncbi:IS256 family transposase [Jeotgalibaca caeni]|uniref:IS256 family transposase n=1 Tax=Jeotgalibaca caeni TaxID=3028623 RepID=UPI00237E5A95|nr:IS256 family transposase [Jeotgalibaca caeni]MDE1549319.1 IS256 family transposase [Jeotgalibaca caeni]
MTQVQFTLNLDDLKDEVMNSNLTAVAKSALVLVMNEMMEKERDEYLKADAYERTDSRMDYRNGYYERELLLSIGRVTLRVLRTRNGDFSPSLFEKYSRADQSFVLAMLEMVVSGVSTRKVKKVVEELCGESVSKSLVSSLTAQLDPIVSEWANRPLDAADYSYVYADAMYIKVREDHRVVSKAVYIAIAINGENQREVIGFKVASSETFEAWRDFFKSLKDRGLRSPNLIVSDAHEGLKKAIQTEFVGTSWQRCLVHFKRNILATVAQKDKKELAMGIKRIFAVLKPEDAREEKERFVDRCMEEGRFGKAVQILEEGFDDAIQYLNEPEETHPFIRSTNHLERLNSEVRRRGKVIRIFPNQPSAYRLIGAVLMDYEKTFSRRLLWERKRNRKETKQVD